MTESAETSADPLDAVLQARRANRAETSRAETASDDRSAAAIAAGILGSGVAAGESDTASSA